MTDHLPECWMADSETAPIFGPFCICPALRACEQRGREEERALVAVERTTLAELNAEYRKGVQAARDAVWQNMLDMTQLEIALAAIDALRNDSADTGTKVPTGYDPTATDNRP